MQIVPPQICHVSTFQAPDCLHYNAVKSIPTITLTAYSLFLKSTFLESPKSHFVQKIQHFSGEDMDIKYLQNALKHAISSEKLFLGGRGLALLPSTHHRHPHQAFWLCSCIPKNSSQIYATGFVAVHGWSGLSIEIVSC